MQGFNKYYPPDFDPQKHGSLNSYRGKHALGDRARKIDQGVLIVRFELPFNIWCDGCNNHIGMGVRYNAEKKKIGNYYSTPIYSFRCKCHLCDNWFVIETDPKNTRYVVKEGAKQKDEEWDPAENGGFAIHDNDKAGPEDPLAALEKSTEAQNHAKNVQVPRLEALQSASDHYNSDPFTLSSRVRKRFREVKKIEKRKRDADDAVKGRYALPEDLALVPDDDSIREEARDVFSKARQEHRADEDAKRRRLAAVLGQTTHIKTQSGSSGLRSLNSGTEHPSLSAALSSERTRSGASSLRSKLLQNTSKRSDPFLRDTQMAKKPPDAKTLGISLKR